MAFLTTTVDLVSSGAVTLAAGLAWVGASCGVLLLGGTFAFARPEEHGTGPPSEPVRWARPFLALAAANNAVWAVVLALAPGWIWQRPPPLAELLPFAVLAVGGCFAANALRRRPRLLWLGTLAKAPGPLVFAVAAWQGWVALASWPLVLVTDVVWLPPLVVLLRRRTSW